MPYKYFKTPSNSSPKNSRRACLCEDNTYHVDCCDGSLQAQGIGNIGGSGKTPVSDYGFKVQLCGHSKQHHVHGNTELTIGNIYYFDLVNIEQSGCYEVLQADNLTSGFLWNNAIAYGDCGKCEADNP
jgi:hypothetical protein